jgi:hypothetical protein
VSRVVVRRPASCYRWASSIRDWLNYPVKRRAMHLITGCFTCRWTLVPVAIEVLRHNPELDDQIAGQVLRFGLAPFLPPQAVQGSLVRTHDDAGV